MSYSDKKTLVERISEFNQQFDYGEYHENPHFWLSVLEHQIDEAWDSYEDGDEPHAYREAADAVLVAFQFMSSCGGNHPPHYILERIYNAEQKGIDEEIVPKYIDWYESSVLNESER